MQSHYILPKIGSTELSDTDLSDKKESEGWRRLLKSNSYFYFGVFLWASKILTQINYDKNFNN